MQLDEITNASDQDVFWIGLREFDGETVSVNGDEAVFTKFSQVRDYTLVNNFKSFAIDVILSTVHAIKII